MTAVASIDNPIVKQYPLYLPALQAWDEERIHRGDGKFPTGVNVLSKLAIMADKMRLTIGDPASMNDYRVAYKFVSTVDRREYHDLITAAREVMKNAGHGSMRTELCRLITDGIPDAVIPFIESMDEELSADPRCSGVRALFRGSCTPDGMTLPDLLRRVGACRGAAELDALKADVRKAMWRHGRGHMISQQPLAISMDRLIDGYVDKFVPRLRKVTLFG
jgi:hypothetical protein